MYSFLMIHYIYLSIKILYTTVHILYFDIFSDVVYKTSNVCTTFGNHDSFNYFNRLNLIVFIRFVFGLLAASKTIKWYEVEQGILIAICHLLYCIFFLREKRRRERTIQYTFLKNQVVFVLYIVIILLFLNEVMSVSFYVFFIYNNPFRTGILLPNWHTH